MSSGITNMWYGQSISTGGGSVEPIDKILYDDFFTGSMCGCAIECGANDGLYLSTCKRFEEFGWHVINIEASKQNFDKLIMNRPLSENYLFALSDADNSTVDICQYEFDNGGMNKEKNLEGCVHIKDHPHTLFKCGTIRYSTLVKRPIDLFVLDVEGAELKVIDGMTGTKYWPRVMCVEHTHVGLQSLCDKLEHKYDLTFYDPLNAIFKYALD